MDVVSGLIGRAQRVDPGLGARLEWMRLRRRGETAARVVDALVRPGAVAVDIGANWGLISWALARRAGAQGHVHAFEPNPLHARSLHRMARRRSMTVHSVALSDEEGTATLHVPVRDGVASHYEATLDGSAAHAGAEQQRVEVPLATLDGVLGDAAGEVAFVKCDVEGHEAAVLRGARRVLAGLPPLLVEIEQRHQQADVRLILAALEGQGYEGWALRAGGLAPLADFDLQAEQLDPLAAGDGDPLAGTYVNEFLFVPPGSAPQALREPSRPAA
jgi:FkbM family methyltransferase